MKKTIICLSAAFLLCGPAAYSQTIAWVFWRYLEVVNVKGEASGWSVEDAFEDIKSCKAAAEKAGQGIARAMKEELLELNAGFWLMKSTKDPPFQSTTYKWLCLPGGTNPGITVRPSSGGEEGRK
jgi:hypothetical protein